MPVADALPCFRAGVQPLSLLFRPALMQENAMSNQKQAAVQVYSFRGMGRVFGFTGDSAGANLPPGYGPWAPFKTLEMVRGTPVPGVNVDECLDDIAAHGFHITDAHVRITQQALG
jgi:hypothetical protein